MREREWEKGGEKRKGEDLEYQNKGRYKWRDEIDTREQKEKRKEKRDKKRKVNKEKNKEVDMQKVKKRKWSKERGVRGEEKENLNNKK